MAAMAAMAAPSGKRKEFEDNEDQIPSRPKRRRGPYKKIENGKEGDILGLASGSVTADIKDANVTSSFVESSSSSTEQNDHLSPILTDSNFLHVDEYSDTENDKWMYETYFSDSSDSSEEDSDNFLPAEYLSDEEASQSKTPLFRIPSRNTPYTSVITKEEHLASVIAYAQRHCSTYQAFSDLLKLIELHLPEENECETSVLKAKAKYVNIEEHIRYHDYCERCFQLFPTDEEITVCPNCLKPEHGEIEIFRFQGGQRSQQKKKRKAFFVSVPVHDQIKDIFERDGIWQDFQQIKMTKRTVGVIKDIMDGEEYRKHCQPGGFLANQNNFSLIFNTDGIPLFKSSGVGIWPVYLAVNELSPCKRFSKRNLVLWGLWQGKKKPVMSTFLMPFLVTVVDLRENGVDVQTPTGKVNTKGLLLLGTNDLQSKAYILNMHQHNGACGCSTCLEEGKHVAQGKGYARYYPFNRSIVERTDQSFRADGKSAVTEGKVVNGIRGKCAFSSLGDWFDIVMGFVPDYMHCVLQGISKTLLRLWFSPVYKEYDFFIGDKVDQVDEILLKIRPTDHINRLPRKLSSNFQHLKASELRAWLLYYCLPCLQGILPDPYLRHLSLLVAGIYLLLGESITSAQLEMANKYLVCFYAQFKDIYGEGSCGLNFHNLSHLVKYVKAWGPLWAWSCFGFESMNGDVLKLVHGTGIVAKEVIWNVCIQRRMSCLASSSDSNSTEFSKDVQKFILKMVSSHTRSPKVTGVTPECKFHGRSSQMDIPEDILDLLQSINVRCTMQKAEKFLRASIGDELYTSRSYTLMTKRNCYTVLFHDQAGGTHVGVIEYFICLANHGYALISVLAPLSRNPLPPFVSHLYAVDPQFATKVVISASQIIQKCIYICRNEGIAFIARMPNTCERD